MNHNDISLKKTPLFAEHEKLGAKMAGFAGWLMPIQYEGIIQEHNHTRCAVSMFDICHMGEFILRGPGAARDIDRLVTSRTDNMSAGACRYGFMLDDNGTFIDDLIVYKIDDMEFMLVVNAARIADKAGWIEKHVSDGTEFLDISGVTAKIDVQGPLSFEVLKEFVEDGLDNLKFYRFNKTRICGCEVLISRTGYTGELGCEIYVDTAEASRVWAELLGDTRLRPAGLGCRDTLRLEMGYPLFGSDITCEQTPMDTGLMRHVHMDKEFTGKSALVKRDEAVPAGRLTGIKLDGRQTARHGCPVMSGDDVIGVVTSGSYSPSLGCAIALCCIRADVSASAVVNIKSGNRVLTGSVQDPPFYKEATGRNKI